MHTNSLVGSWFWFLSFVIVGSDLIIAFVLFIAVQGINRMKKKEEAQPAALPAPTATEKLLVEIRDLLKK